MQTRRLLRIPHLAAAFLLLAAVPGRAEFISAPDVVVYADPSIGAALRAVGGEYRARTGVPVRVFCAASEQLLSLIVRGTRTDVLVTLAPQMDRAAAAQLIDRATRTGAWRDPLVLAGRNVAAGEAPVSAAALAGRLGASGVLAVIDPTAPTSVDGPALLARLGWALPAMRVVGAIDGPGVAFMLSNWEATLGVLPRSDALADPTLTVAGVIPGDGAPPLIYSAAITRNVLSRNAATFVDFLKTPAATATLRAAGLEETVPGLKKP